MKFTFYKFQGCGNDFIIIDDRNEKFTFPAGIIEHLCNRRFGIGADGLILVRNHSTADFEMVYYNSDGRISSMCGNGSRCIVSFAYDFNLIKENAVFMAADGLHEAVIKKIINRNEKTVAVKMGDVTSIDQQKDFIYLNTGSPHVVIKTSNLENLNVFEEGRKIRYSERFKTDGTNVNFVEDHESFLKVRTYERGVEDETLSCGTGVTAAAIASTPTHGKNECKIQTPGGDLTVTFNKQSDSANDVWLIGPAVFVYKGETDI